MWYFSHRARLAYLNVPKSACTTIHFLLLAAERPDEVRAALAGADRPESVAWQLQYDMRDVLTPSKPLPDECRDYLRFSFVRHPTKRIISGYLNKILMWKDDSEKIHEHDPDLFEKRYAPGGFRPQMPLEEFINRLHRAKPEVVNGHFRQQTVFLTRGGQLQVDFVGRVERLKENLQRILPADVHDLIDTKLNVTPPPPPLEMSAKAYKRLQNYVSEEARFFRYEPDQLPSYVSVTN